MNPIPSVVEVMDTDSPYLLNSETVHQFRTNGFIRLENVFKVETLRAYELENSIYVCANTRSKRNKAAARSTYEREFIQLVNLWWQTAYVTGFVFGSKLARIVNEFLGASGIRWYHDQALYKKPGGRYTPWHADQYYWPLSSSQSCTAWIPSQKTPLDMGPLSFNLGCHEFSGCRDLAISDESEHSLDTALSARGHDHHVSAFSLGDVSFHSGCTYHHAGPIHSDSKRKAMTTIYMEDGIRLTPSIRSEQGVDREAFIPGRKQGERADIYMNPLLYP